MKRIDGPRVDIIDHKTLVVLNEAIAGQRAPTRPEDYNVWLRYHKKLVKQFNKFGVAGDASAAQPDFYYSGDWFHHELDGFALRTTTCLTAPLFMALQKVVKRHHANASLWLVGDSGTPADQLCFLITPTVMLGAYVDETAAVCRRRLDDLGINLQA